MSKIQKIITSLWNDQALKFYWQRNSSMQKESYHATYATGSVRVQAADERAALYAAFQLRMAAQAKELSACLDRVRKPHYPLRPLWIGCDLAIEIFPSVSLAIPRSWKNLASVEEFCLDLLRWGYNAVILGVSFHFPLSLQEKAPKNILNQVISQFSSYGIHIIVALHQAEQTDIDILQKENERKYKKTFTKLAQQFPVGSYLLWHGIGGIDVRKQRGYEEFSEAQLTLKQIEVLLKILPSSLRLIYSLPHHNQELIEQQASFLPQVLFDVPINVLFAFSARSGSPTEDYLPLHPLVEKSRKSLYPFSAQLMPICNAGLIGQGEGLWPVVPYDSFQELFANFHSCNFYGVIGLTRYLPKPAGLLDLSLWMLGLCQWDVFPLHFMPHIWLSVYHPQFDLLIDKKNILQLQQIVLSFNLFRQDINEGPRKQMQKLFELVVQQIKICSYFEWSWHKKQTEQSHLWQVYLSSFLCDLKKITALYAQQHQLQNTVAACNENEEWGFWSTQDFSSLTYEEKKNTFPIEPSTLLEKSNASQVPEKAVWLKKIWDDNRKNDAPQGSKNSTTVKQIGVTRYF